MKQWTIKFCCFLFAFVSLSLSGPSYALSPFHHYSLQSAVQSGRAGSSGGRSRCGCLQSLAAGATTLLLLFLASWRILYKMQQYDFPANPFEKAKPTTKSFLKLFYPVISIIYYFLSCSAQTKLIKTRQRHSKFQINGD